MCSSELTHPDGGAGQPPAIDTALLARHDVRAPRYTSYPTAPQFSDALGESAYRRAAQACHQPGAPLSVYVHIPFCRTVCFYCGCNKVITANYRRAGDYLDRLAREMALQAPMFADRPVTQLHFGGGTPTYLNEVDLRRVMADLARHFQLVEAPSREYSIEIDPRTVDPDKVALLAALGFNRMSLGIQDFDPDVQAAVNRRQSLQQTAAVLDAARASGFRSSSVDLIYGLPRQTPASFKRTLDAVIGLRPERIAVYGYAHMPEMFKVQRQIPARSLPDAGTRLLLLQASIERLRAAGYLYIGMDHFALPDDTLARARRDGSLQRNFQGYSTHAQCDLLGLGVSAIGKVGAIYAQNARDLAQYQRRLDEGRLAVVRGFALDADDRVRGDVIQALMCQGQVSFDAIGARHDLRFADYFAAELQRLQPLAADGLVVVGPDALEVTARGRLFLRNLAMVFDAYLPPQGSPGFSRAV
jgi:oxygen-independent coproporphyrinogen-3 oxidase